MLQAYGAWENRRRGSASSQTCQPPPPRQSLLIKCFRFEIVEIGTICDLVAELILEAVLSDAPKAAYSIGPFSKELLGERAHLDDDQFYGFMLQKFDLKGFTV